MRDSESEGSEVAGKTGMLETELAALRLAQGTQVFGRDGTRLGLLSRDGIQDGYLIMRRMYGSPELALPESVVILRDATGVYIDLTWRDLDALIPPRPGTEEGLLDAFATATSVHANRFEDDSER